MQSGLTHRLELTPPKNDLKCVSGAAENLGFSNFWSYAHRVHAHFYFIIVCVHASNVFDFGLHCYGSQPFILETLLIPSCRSRIS